MSSEAKVGLITLIAIILLFLILNVLNIFEKEEAGYQINVIFKNASGLSVGASVCLAGVKVGNVKELSLTPQGKARATLFIKKGVLLHRDYAYTITGGLMGDRWIEITARPTKLPPLIEGEEVEGQTPVSLDELITSGYHAINDLHKTITRINEYIGNPQVLSAFRDTIFRLNRTLENLEVMIVSLQEITTTNVSQVARNIDQLVINLNKDAREISSDFHRFGTILNRIAGTNESDIKDIVTNLRQSSEDLKSTMETIEKFVVEEETSQQVKDIIASFRKTGKKVEKIAQGLEEFVADKKMKEDLKTTISNAREVMSVTRTLLEPTKKAIERYQPEEGEPFQFTSWNVASEWVSKVDWPITSLQMELFPTLSRFYLIGIRDIGYENELNIQVGNRPNPKQTTRIGIIESQLGVGYDEIINDKMYISLDLYDPKKLKFNVCTYLGIQKKWELKLGIRDFFDARHPVIGVKKEF